MPNIVYIATSLDGFIAGPNGELDWLMEFPNPGNSDFGFSEFIEEVDALVMGRNTFEMVVSFGEWPYTKPVHVLSSTLKTVPENLVDKADIVCGELPDIINQLHEIGHRNLYIDGGKTVQGFLEADLIDEMRISRLPLLLGDGIPLFDKLDQPLLFEVEENTTLENGITQSRYIRKR